MLEQRNKEIRQKTCTCAKHETPKKICKTYAKPKIPKEKNEKKRN